MVGFTKCVAFFSLFFYSIWDFSGVCGGVREKVNSAFDRARRVLSWSLLLRLWSPFCANPIGKYANPDPRYPTSLMDTSYNIPMYFATDESQDNHVDFDKQLYSNNSTESENIFIECIRLFLHNGDESGYDKNIKDPSNSLFSMNCKKV